MDFNAAINNYKQFIQKVNNNELAPTCNEFAKNVILMHPQISEFSEEWMQSKINQQIEFCKRALPYVKVDNGKLIEEFERFLSLIPKYNSVSPSTAADLVWHALMCAGKMKYLSWSVSIFGSLLGHNTDDDFSAEVEQKIKSTNGDVVYDGTLYMKSKIATTCTARCSNPCDPLSATCTARCSNPCSPSASS